MKVLLIIPAYNEEENILKVVDMVKSYDGKHELDYIFVNDGSSDKTAKILEENNLNHVNLTTNLGIGGAVQTGYKYAFENDYDVAIQFDGDGQHDISYVDAIVEPLESGEANMCIGTRYLDKSESEFQSTHMRRLGSSIISTLINLLCHTKITDPTSGFRAADKEVIEFFAKQYPTDYPEPESAVRLLNQNFRVTEVPVSMNERMGGVTSISPIKSIDYMIKVPLALFIDKFR